MKLICKYLGGSRCYGLETESSDYDYRGVFIHTEVSKIIGLERFDHFETIKENEDIKYKELREWFNLLRRGNTEALECLFNTNWLEKDKIFDRILENRWSFVDNNTIFNCLRGYAASELKLANGLRTGKLGGKRKEAIDKYGFSPSNFVNYFRLLECGIRLFRDAEYIVNWKNCNCYSIFMNLKIDPESFLLSHLNALAVYKERELINVFQNCKIDRKFDNKLANEIIKDIYLKYL